MIMALAFVLLWFSQLAALLALLSRRDVPEQKPRVP